MDAAYSLLSALHQCDAKWLGGNWEGPFLRHPTGETESEALHLCRQNPAFVSVPSSALRAACTLSTSHV